MQVFEGRHHLVVSLEVPLRLRRRKLRLVYRNDDKCKRITRMVRADNSDKAKFKYYGNHVWLPCVTKVTMSGCHVLPR
jgi:hypothetical protein